MVEPRLGQSPLAALGLASRVAGEGGTAGVLMWEPVPRAMIDLRGDAARKAFRDAVAGVLGSAPPRAPNTTAGGGDWRIFWLGPDQWLAVGPADREAATVAALEKTLARQHAAVTAVGGARAVIGLAGVHARDVLAKGSSLDFHPRAFALGDCAQSRLALALALIHRTADDDKDGRSHWDIYVPRSFAEYLWRWLEDAGQEYGVALGAG